MLKAMLTIVAVVSAPAQVNVYKSAVEYLRPVLKSVSGAARVNYGGTCVGHELRSPLLLAQPAPVGATGISAVRQIFAGNPHVTVALDPTGVVRITIGSVATTALQTRLPALTLNPNTQYTAAAAVDAIAIAADTFAKGRNLSFGMAATNFDNIMNGPAKGAPHLPPVMKNVTVDQALDAITSTFKGIVLYGTCKQSDGKELFKINYVYSQ